ncbi:AraC-like ligand binding domain-containing protein [Cohaesibacter sp. ES.047]|uniref:AraC family transcriptional regulator n=1 Tax=Cohaesibacter sp. ES.047 TaxID=1798205 RepID=UPI000BB817EA|nr:AraC family transcriptional regulator [Cohaesibacter sp. ES.047]SNY93362.1 AraC-like ligand binding domain-containing protein [Cohaesibacter sp. ES.047]
MDRLLLHGQPQIRDGFPGQRSAVLPRSVVSSWLAGDPLLDMVPSDVGYYPSAESHFVDRPKGSAQLILIYCFAGEGWAQIAGNDFRIESGQVLVVPPNAPHMYGAHQYDPWTIYWIHLAGRKTKTLLRLLELGETGATLYPGHDPALPSLFERIWHLLNRDYSEESLQSASTACHQLAAHLIAMRHRLQDGEDGHSTRIKDVIEVMHQALDRKLSLEELAQTANMSKSHFAFVFKKRTGFAPLDYFMRLKMQRACFLLDTTNMPVKAIASVLAFEDSLYFSRRFRHIHNCSPVQYRAIQKG